MKYATRSLLSAAALLVSGPVALAQGETAAAEPAAEAEQQVSPMASALAGFHIAVLQDGEGGVASVENDAGDAAVIAFLVPEAAETAKTESQGDMQVGVIPLGVIMQNWNGPVVFESGQNEIAKATELAPEAEGFAAPVFFVTTDGKETRMKTPDGYVTPILTSYDDATQMASKLEEQGMDESTISIIPIELAAVLQQIDQADAPTSYRVFTHPETVTLLEASTTKQ